MDNDHPVRPNLVPSPANRSSIWLGTEDPREDFPGTITFTPSPSNYSPIREILFFQEADQIAWFPVRGPLLDEENDDT